MCSQKILQICIRLKTKSNRICKKGALKICIIMTTQFSFCWQLSFSDFVTCRNKTRKPANHNEGNYIICMHSRKNPWRNMLITDVTEKYTYIELQQDQHLSRNVSLQVILCTIITTISKVLDTHIRWVVYHVLCNVKR